MGQTVWERICFGKVGGVGPNMNEDGHGKFFKRVTSECCNTKPATGTSRLREEVILNWEHDKQDREWEKMRS